MKERSVQFRRGLEALAQHPIVGEGRSAGLMGAVEIVADKSTKALFRKTDRLGRFLLGRAYHHGIITRFTGSALTLVPPLVISEADLAEIFVRMKRILDDAWQAAGKEFD